jgi:hypothetical protein
VVGLAAWRMGDCNAAANAFAAVGNRSGDLELGAAGNYWAARADMRCKRPALVQARLRTAARAHETFYGLLAREALGIKTNPADMLHDYRDAEWLRSRPSRMSAPRWPSRRSARPRWPTTSSSIRPGSAARRTIMACSTLASDLNFVGTQYYLAHHAPRGTKVNMAARYPMPDWRPARGVASISRCSSPTRCRNRFPGKAVSQAGATGLLQVRPGTAGDIARARGEPFDPKPGRSRPEYGIRPELHREPARPSRHRRPAPQGDRRLQCRPGADRRVEQRAMDGGDPLLYIESIPYWETRGYVPIVLRNYWIYEQKAGKPSASRHALAQGMWPRFPACRARARCGWSRSGGGAGGRRRPRPELSPYRAAMGRGTMRSMVEGPRDAVAPSPAYGWSPSPKLRLGRTLFLLVLSQSRTPHDSPRSTPRPRRAREPGADAFRPGGTRVGRRLARRPDASGRRPAAAAHHRHGRETQDHPRPQHSPDVSFDRSINPYRGCEHGCIYCFARPTHAFHDLSPGLDFESKLFAKRRGEAAPRRAGKRGYVPQTIAIGTNTDPYQPIEGKWRIMRSLLEVLAETRHPLCITTKSDRIVRDSTSWPRWRGRASVRLDFGDFADACDPPHARTACSVGSQATGRRPDAERCRRALQRDRRAVVPAITDTNSRRSWRKRPRRARPAPTTFPFACRTKSRPCSAPGSTSIIRIARPR